MKNISDMNCRLCDSGQLKLYYTQGEKSQYKLYKCKNCGLVNLDLQDINQIENQEKYSLIFIDPLSKKKNRAASETYKFIKRNIDKGVLQKGHFMDIGCGNGALLNLAKEDGWNVKGLELSEYLKEKIEESLGIDVFVSDFLEYEPQEQFDLVSLRHVLEHLPDSRLALMKINRMLKPGGHALLEFPNIEAFSFKMKRFLSNSGIYHKKHKEGWVPGHCNEFSLKPWKFLLNKTGFELLRWETYSLKPFKNAIYKLINTGNKVRTLIRKQ